MRYSMQESSVSNCLLTALLLPKTLRDSAHSAGTSGASNKDTPLPLFRQQAIDHASVRQYGAVLLTRA